MAGTFVVGPSSNANEVCNDAVATRTHAPHDDDIFWSFEVSVLATVLDNAQGEHPANPWQSLQLIRRRAVQIKPDRTRRLLTSDRGGLDCILEYAAPGDDKIEQWS